MKRLSILSILLFVLLGSTFVILPASAQNSDLETTITQNANIRSGPDTSYDRVAVGHAGTRIRLDGRTSSGNWVRGITSRGVVGWLSSGTVNINMDQLVGLRIISIGEPFNLTAPAQPTTASSSGGSGLLVSATAGVNVRSGPSTAYRRITGLAIGDTLNVDGRDASGNWVRGITAYNKVGWVYATYLTISAQEIAALPVVNNDTPFALGAPSGGTSTDTSTTTTAPSQPVTAVISTTAVRGFNLGGHVAGFSDEAANWMRVAGMTWIKRQHRYIDGQNANDLSGMINNTHARGFRLLLGVVGYKHELNNPGYYDRYASFVAGLAGLGIDAIEVWNEPNIDHEWPSGQISPQSYTDLLRIAYNAAKGANPNVMIVSAAPAPTGFFGGCGSHGCDDNHFVSGMAGAGAANYMDCIGIHYNEGIVPPSWTSGDPRGNSGHYTRYFKSMMDVYYGAFGGSRPLCFTELGYLSPEGFGPLPANFAWAVDTSVAEHAAWLDQAASIARSSGRVRMMIIWNVDFTAYGSDPMAGYAIIRPGGGCPACEALGS